MEKNRRFTVIEHWTCEECDGEGKVYEDAHEQAQYRRNRVAALCLILGRAHAAPTLVAALRASPDPQYHSERIACRACKGEGRGQREVPLEEALKALGVLPGVGAVKRPDI